MRPLRSMPPRGERGMEGNQSQFTRRDIVAEGYATCDKAVAEKQREQCAHEHRGTAPRSTSERKTDARAMTQNQAFTEGPMSSRGVAVRHDQRAARKGRARSTWKHLLAAPAPKISTRSCAKCF